MSADLVEIALDQFTDGFLFEKIAADVMRDEGYHDIKRLGGSGDFGMDAVEDVFYEELARTRIVFQFTLEDYVLKKMRNTIEKLRGNGVEFAELVIVTAAKLSTERQENVRKTARREFGVTASCFHRDTIVNRLSDYTNGIFHRCFPSIDQQLKELREAKPLFDDGDNARETAVLKTAISFGIAAEAASVRKSLFDRVVLAVLVLHSDQEFSEAEIANLIAESLECGRLPDSQITASLKRLRDEVNRENGRYAIKKDVALHADAATTAVNRITESLLSDLVERVCESTEGVISSNTRRRIERNAKDVIRELLRLNSMELASLARPDAPSSGAKPDVSGGLVELARRQVLVS